MPEERFPSKMLNNKTIISKGGRKFGEVEDLIFEVKSGEILYIVVKNPTEFLEHLDIDKDEEGNLLIPFSSVIAIGDFLVVNEEEIV